MFAVAHSNAMGDCELNCLSDLLYDADEKLFKRMAASGHCIHQSLSYTNDIMWI